MNTKLKQLLEIIHFAEDKINFNVEYTMQSEGCEFILKNCENTESSYIKYYDCRKRIDNEHWICYDLYIYKDFIEEILDRLCNSLSSDATYQRFTDAKADSVFFYFECEKQTRVDFVKLKGENLSIQIVQFY